MAAKKIEIKKKQDFLELAKINKYIPYVFIIIITAVVYINSLQNEFVFDDESVVVNNTAIQKLSNIPKYFTAEEGFHKVIGRYYRPVVFATYATDYALGGGLNPFYFHLTNVIIHVISSLLVLAIFIKLFKNKKYGLLASIAGALIFAVHPIHTEAVSWISGRTDSLASLFFFAAFLFYISDSRKYLIPVVLFYILGLLSKEMVITFPLVIIAYDLIYNKEKVSGIRKKITEYSVLIIVTLLYLYLRYLMLIDIPERTTYLYFYEKDTLTITATMLKTIPVYFKLLFFPFGLIYHYNGIIRDAYGFLDYTVILSVLFIVVLIILAVYMFKNNNVISFCILFFFITLIPVMNIIPTMNLMAERFLYITSFCLSVFLSYIIIKYIKSKNSKFTAFLIIIIAFIFSYYTYNRNSDWKTNNTLYSTGEGIDGTVLLVNSGNIYANRKQFDEAEKLYRKALEIRDNILLAHHNLGLIYMIRGNYDSAEIKFKKGISIDSLSPVGYVQLSNLYQQMGRYDDAVEALTKLQKLIPDYPDVKLQIEQINVKKNNPVADPKDPKLLSMEKQSYDLYLSGKYNESIKILEEMIKSDPANSGGYYNNIALCYEGMNEQDKAIESYEKALSSNEQNLNSLNGISKILLKKGDNQSAIYYMNKILELTPNDEITRHTIDSLLKIKDK
ncbi:MAG: tetratricopeptide repeat protein [Ignavibacteria bacterium]|nr:tetratricopeptide repeat protein [Ignavibacteria bacterium]